MAVCYGETVFPRFHDVAKTAFPSWEGVSPVGGSRRENNSCTVRHSGERFGMRFSVGLCVKGTAFCACGNAHRAQAGLEREAPGRQAREPLAQGDVPSAMVARARHQLEAQ